MQNTALNEVFTDEYVNSVNDGLDHLSKVFIESCASTAYNEVIFEAALSDEILEEADKAHSTFTGIKNAAFKAIQTLKMAFKSIFNKIRVAINEFIKNQNEKKVTDMVKTYNKNKASEHDEAMVIVKDLSLDPKVVFPVTFNFKDFVIVDEEKQASKLAGALATGLGKNYKGADKDLKDAKKVSDVNKVLTGITSYPEEEKKPRSFADMFTGKVSQEVVKVAPAVKNGYTKAVGNINDYIKKLEGQLKTASDEECKDIKDEVLAAQRLLSFEHAVYIGYLKWAVACNKQLMNTISKVKSGKADKYQESAFEEFMGLQLL